MSKELIIKNVRQFHTETDGKGHIVIWVETTSYDYPIKDVTMEDKET